MLKGAMRCSICQYRLNGLDPAALCPECGATETARDLHARQRHWLPVCMCIGTSALVTLLFSVFWLKYLLVLFVIPMVGFPYAGGLFLVVYGVRPRTRVEALAATLPICAVLPPIMVVLVYMASEPDPLAGIAILASPIFTVPGLLISALVGWGFVKRIRRNANDN